MIEYLQYQQNFKAIITLIRCAENAKSVSCYLAIRKTALVNENT